MPEAMRRSWLLGPFSLWIGFFWGLAEATLFFIVPDIWLTLVALFSVKQSGKVLAAILLGAMAGGSFMFFWGQARPEPATATVLHVPFVSETMFSKTHQSLEDYRLWALVKAPASGIPYKLYAVQASRYARLLPFLLITLLARLERFALFWFIACAIGMVFRRSIDRRRGITIAVHACIWIAGYAWYWTAIVRIGR
jgi:membrane protein YqaA with SNARE-associated domain